MARGNAPQTKVVFQGKADSFVIFVENKEIVESWKKDRSIPLVQVVAGFKVFCTYSHGAQNVGDEASKSQLDNEFGTHNQDEVIIKLLEAGEVQASENAERHGNTNISRGPAVAH